MRWIAAVGVLAVEAHAANLTLDGSKQYQPIDGIGVNINVNSWKNGELKPALDALVDQNGMSLVRVIRDPMDWVSSESLVPSLHALDAGTLMQVYEQQKMTDLWDTIAYLNQKGLRGKQVMVNFMGWTPVWLGGSGAYGVASHITAGKEQEWATMVASLVYYGRKVRGLDFSLLGPLNEEDWNCLEGPCVGASQYVVALEALSAELDTMGVTDVRFEGPDCAGSPGAWLTGMMASTIIHGRTDHLGLHQYGGATSPGMDYAGENYWLSETAASCGNCDYAGTPQQGEWAFAQETNDAVIGDLTNGIAGVLVYDGYDSFYFHHNSLGFWGLLSYDGGTYAPRKRFWVNAQIARFVRPGMVRIDENDTINALVTAAAFLDPASGQLVLIGHNDSTSAMGIDGQLDALSQVTSLALYETTPTDDLQQRAAVSVSGSGAFSAMISPNAFFTLVSGGAPVDAGTGGGAGGSGGTGGGASATGGGAASSGGGTASSGGGSASAGGGASTGTGGGSAASGGGATATGGGGGAAQPGCGCDAPGSSLLALLLLAVLRLTSSRARAAAARRR
jgi:O-glycosyl hydrolase